MSTIEFQQNFSILENSLNAFAYSLTKNIEDARDLYQETAYRAIHNKDKFKEDTNLKAWTFTIMKNIFINNYRKKVKANTILDHSDNSFFIDSTSSNKPINEGGRKMFMEELEEMIAKLDDNIRIPFLMHFEGYKYNEIADEFHLPLGTVKSRIFFARKALKDMILRNYGDENTVRSLSA
jgi:RNA polymerase sigma-70 factor (ECF subfamily)